MLTRALLVHRTRDGKLRPGFVDAGDRALAALADELVATAAAAVGGSLAALEEGLASRIGGEKRQRVAAGLVKLLLDGAEVAAPRPEVGAARAEALRIAARVLGALPAGATRASYEEALELALPRPLEEIRTTLHADLPPGREVLAVRAESGQALLHRYNLALVQGLLLHARRVTVRATAPGVVPVRRLLRWLRFCRLVAQVDRDGDSWTLQVEGPAAVLSLQKGYGLQLATFLPMVPLLPRFALTAEVQLPRKQPALLQIGHADGLVCPHPEGLGHVPEEVAAVAAAFEDAAWRLELSPAPRNVGARGICVPDLGFRHAGTGEERFVELFHRWHRGPLASRLAQLEERPDPALILGIDRSLLDGSARELLEHDPRVFVFNGFPSAKKLRDALERAGRPRPGD